VEGIEAIRGPIFPGSPTELAERDAVCRLPRLYALGIDLRDEAMVRSVFTSDAAVRGVLGEFPVDEYIPQLLAGVTPYEATMHNITNQYAEVEGDEAAVWSYAVALHLCSTGTGSPAPNAAGPSRRDTP
jgi:SnoaL-like domain